MIGKIELPDSMMAFQLKDGTILYITKADCEKIASEVAVSSMLNAQSLVTEFLEKRGELAIGIKQIQAILEKYPDMNKDKKDECIDLMVQLIKKYVKQS